MTKKVEVKKTDITICPMCNKDGMQIINRNVKLCKSCGIRMAI